MIGLVLEGGGVKGSYQIGSYYAFKNCKIKISGFVGTSIGSFNAAMLASHNEGTLLDFWYNVNPGLLLGFDPKLIENINNDSFNINSLLGSFKSLTKIIKNFGIDNTKMLAEIDKLISFDELQKSESDFGLVTVKVSRKGIEPIYVNKENITSKKELLEYLMASCYLPVFKEKRILDNHYYIDGGFYDNAPFKLLLDKGYRKIYIINIKGIGINRRLPKTGEITTISPSRNNGKILELNRDIIRDNIMMGYYDTLRVLKKLDGYKYCFKKRSNKYYKFLARKVPKRELRRVMNFLKTSTYKETVLKALEYILEKENINYYDVYNVYRTIRKLRKKENNHFIYQFIKKIKFI